MASPIFLSKPHPGFSAQAFENGAKLALWEFWRFAIRFVDICRGDWRVLLKLSLVSVTWRVVTLPLYKTAQPFLLLTQTLQALEMWLSCFYLLTFAYPDFSWAFWRNFQPFAKSREAMCRSNADRVRKSSLSATKRFPWYIVFLLLLGTLMIEVSQVHAAGLKSRELTATKMLILLALWDSTLKSALGSFVSIAVGAIMTTCLSLQLNLVLIMQFYELHLLMHFLLVPYVSVAQFTATEYSMWVKARGGVICGFMALVYVLVSSSGRLVSPVLMYLLVFPFACFMAEIAEPVPTGISLGAKAHSAWCARQLLWLNRLPSLEE
ncbi:LANO_0B02190g1_1 [Lachancea nothofagi CBS 11611]|uniref:LANO_0B02190g1_1 n=1 Tax=Lachancea nothofagi CBS 11611 TaxID=1266666 RepID=A0A1G4IWG6_9SACH|nr:LANO_0B02190g1_1 [Lachancea nothofagi CBS 11611]